MANEDVPPACSAYYELAAVVLLILTFVLSRVANEREGRAGENAGDCAGISIILLVAIGVSRIWKRARNRRTTAKVAFFTLLLLFAAQGSRLLQAPRRIVAAGASFAPPENWIVLKAPEDRDKKRMGWFVPPDCRPDRPYASIVVESGRAADATLEETADHLASDWGGQVLDEETTLDGVRALRVKATNDSATLAPVEAIVALRGTTVVLIMGGVISGSTCHEEVEEVRRSWRWVK